MKQILSDDAVRHLDELISDSEKKLGIQIVMSVVRRSDSYSEIPWKVFAVVASVAGLAVIVISSVTTYWVSQSDVMTGIAATLITGAFFALLTVLLPGVARLFLPGHRAEEEVHQYADSLFTDRHLNKTHDRTAVLVLISLFERKIIIVPDTGLKDKLLPEDMQKIIDRMKPFLRKGDSAGAFEECLSQLNLILEKKPSHGDKDDELPNLI